MQERVTTRPAIPESQNGSGTVGHALERFESGNLIWLQDERGFITHHEYAAGPGLVTRTIQDVDDSLITVPTGWETPVGGASMW